MIKFNRNTEYGLIALRYLQQKKSASLKEVVTAREIADQYLLPFEFIAKTLQRLKEAGFIESLHGARGGYLLRRPFEEVTLAEYLEVMEGPHSLVTCVQETQDMGPQVFVSGCEYGQRCEIKTFMRHLNTRLFGFLSGIKLSEFFKEGHRV